MGLSDSRIRVTQDLLAGVRRVSPASAVLITAHIAVSVADIVLVPRVEFVVSEPFEALAPENNALFQRQPNSFEEEGILQSSVVLQVVVLA